MSDDIRDMLERGWRAVQEIDESLSRGEIDFDFVHIQHLDYVPPTRRRELVAHLLTRICEPGGSLIIEPFNEVKAEHTTEGIVTEWGYRIVGHAERQHRHPDIAYRAFWIDAVYR